MAITCGNGCSLAITCETECSLAITRDAGCSLAITCLTGCSLAITHDTECSLAITCETECSQWLALYRHSQLNLYDTHSTFNDNVMLIWLSVVLHRSRTVVALRRLQPFEVRFRGYASRFSDSRCKQSSQIYLPSIVTCTWIGKLQLTHFATATYNSYCFHKISRFQCNIVCGNFSSVKLKPNTFIGSFLRTDYQFIFVCY